MSSFQVDVQEILVLVNAVEIAINKTLPGNQKVYSKEQIDNIFPVWNNVTANLQKLQRQNAIDQLYSQTQEVSEKNDNETEVVVSE
jgi:hypothetical protein